MINKWGLCSLLLIGYLYAFSVTAQSYTATGGFYLKYFGGKVDPATLPRVYQVFRNVRNAADKHAWRWPELLVIQKLPGYQALALPDGNIILSAEAVKLIYNNVTDQQGDIRLAFILGHEMAHLAENDFWEDEIAQALVGLPKGKQLKAILGLGKQQHEQTRKETQADDKGLLYAALAGYPVGLLFRENQQHSDFLSNWVQMTQSTEDIAHAPASVRAQLLQQRLKQRVDLIAQFQFAIRLAHFGRCTDAIPILEDLLTLFPGRALYNNIGYCYLQQGLDIMPANAKEYWLPGILELQSRLSTSLPAGYKQVLRGGQLNPQANHYLKKASKALKAAALTDPYYLPAQINLASVFFLREDIYQARAVIESARKLMPNNVDIQSLRLLILHKEAIDQDIITQVIGLLQALIREHPEHGMTRFNLAKLLSRYRSPAAAQQHWQILLENKHKLPPAKYHLSCQEVAKQPACQSSQNIQGFYWAAPIAIGTDLLTDNSRIQQLLGNMLLHEFQFTGLVDSQAAIYTNNSFAVLSFDNIVEMVVIKQADVENTQQLIDKAGEPVWINKLANGDIWNYDGWAVWVLNEQIKEIWIAKDGFVSKARA